MVKLLAPRKAMKNQAMLVDNDNYSCNVKLQMSCIIDCIRGNSQHPNCKVFEFRGENGKSF